MKSSWIVVDTSLVVGLVTHDERDRLRAMWRRWQGDGVRLTAPTLLLYELTNVLHQHLKRELLSPRSAHRFLALVDNLGLEIVHDSTIHTQALNLADRLSLPANYHAHYLALGQRLGAEFWTLDQELVRSVGSQLPWVRLAVGER